MGFLESFKELPAGAIDDIVETNAFTIWSHYFDPDSLVFGILGANSEKLGIYYLNNDGQLGLDPPELVGLRDARFMIDKTARTFRIHLFGQREFYEPVVFDDVEKMGDNPSGTDPVLLEELDRTLARWAEWVTVAYHRNRFRSWLEDQADKVTWL